MGDRSAPVAADTIGGTTGISQLPNVIDWSRRWRVNIRYGIAAAASRPVAVPRPQRTLSTTTAECSPMR